MYTETSDLFRLMGASMRIFGGLFIMVLMTAAIMLFLQAEDAEKSIDAVNAVANNLHESGIEGKSADRDAAKRMISAMEALVESPGSIEDNMEGLREIAAIAASWAKAAPSPSAELHMAVGIRGAANELRAYGSRPSDSSLQRARNELAKARDGLMGRAGASGPADGIADRLQNLDQSHKEMYQDIEELGN